MTTKVLDEPKTGSAQPNEAVANLGGKYLTFKLADEEYGVEVLKAREILQVTDITAIPLMPAYMKGVINLRGKVIPVVDLRLRLGFEEIEHTEDTCIIVVDVGKEMGIIVDAVSEALHIAGENIDQPPSLGASVDTSFILGMGKVGDSVKVLIDIDKVLVTDEQIDIAQVLRANGRP